MGCFSCHRERRTSKSTFARNKDGITGFCDACAEKAGAFADATVTEPVKCACGDPTAEATHRTDGPCFIPVKLTRKARPVVEKAKPLTCSHDGGSVPCSGSIARRHYRLASDMVAEGPMCDGHWMWREQAAAEKTAQHDSQKKPRPAAHPGVVAQVVGPFVGILGARGMTIAAGSGRPRPPCPIHGDNHGACDGTTGCARPR